MVKSPVAFAGIYDYFAPPLFFITYEKNYCYFPFNYIF